jgi:hypothetical protein
MNKLFLLSFFLLLTSGVPRAQGSQQLFVMERNTNSNRVYYEAKITADSLLDSQNPIHAYWIMWSKDPSGKTREELNILEKEKGFGFKVQKNPSRKFLWFSIVSLPRRPIKVSVQSEGAIAETIIDGRFSIVEKIAINAVEKNFLPHVNYIELFGRTAKNGEETYEKIVNR